MSMSSHKHVSRSDTTQQVQTMRAEVVAAADSIGPELERLTKSASSAAMASVRLGRAARRVRSNQAIVAATGESVPDKK
jgi:hypothetical protein